MCGRYASARKRIELLEEFSVQRDRVAEDLTPDYNVAPTRSVYAVMDREQRASDADKSDSAPKKAAARKDAGHEPAAGPPEAGAVARELRVVRWGLVPSWAKDISIGSRLINARAETVASKPAFRRAFARHRCLLPADGFYEWEKSGDPKKPTKQPYYIRREDGGVPAFAGLYELWRDKDRPDDDPDSWLWTATIITTRAEDEVGRIHDRMPMVIEPARWADWLDPAATSAEALHGLMTPAASVHLTTYPVSTEVNSVRHNGPGLIEPMEGDSDPAGSPRDGAGGRSDASRGAPSTLF
jgi:putative SOS response-associated peptidase YedK